MSITKYHCVLEKPYNAKQDYKLSQMNMVSGLRNIEVTMVSLPVYLGNVIAL